MKREQPVMFATVRPVRLALAQAGLMGWYRLPGWTASWVASIQRVVVQIPMLVARPMSGWAAVRYEVERDAFDSIKPRRQTTT
jgi:hypothetical protein